MKSKQPSPCSNCMHRPVMPVTSQANHMVAACTHCMGSKVSSLSGIYLYSSYFKILGGHIYHMSYSSLVTNGPNKLESYTALGLEGLPWVNTVTYWAQVAKKINCCESRTLKMIAMNKLSSLPYFIKYSVHFFYMENDAEIFPVHYTWKVTEKGFKMASMMNKLEMINICEIILEN